MLSCSDSQGDGRLLIFSVFQFILLENGYWWNLPYVGLFWFGRVFWVFFYVLMDSSLFWLCAVFLCVTGFWLFWVWFVFFGRGGRVVWLFAWIWPIIEHLLIFHEYHWNQHSTSNTTPRTITQFFLYIDNSWLVLSKHHQLQQYI